MNKVDKAQEALCNSLGKNYKIRTIDLESVIYRDFGNGFNVEVSGTHTLSERKRATIYLWFGTTVIVKIRKEVLRGNIGDVVEELRAYSEDLLRKGYNTADSLWELANAEREDFES